MRGCSVGKSHLLRVAQFVQVGVAGQLHHRGWPTEQQQHIVPWGGQVLLDHVGRHKALAVGPICTGRGENDTPGPCWQRGAVRGRGGAVVVQKGS